MPAEHDADEASAAALPPPRYGRDKYRIAMVCLGNICRSPIAEVIMRDELAAARLTGRVSVSSAGTGDWHVGGPMDRRASAELARHGLDGSSHRASQISPDRLAHFDLLLAMDRSNQRNLRAMAGSSDSSGRIRLLRSFDPAAPPGAQVPDPYGGKSDDFETVFSMVQAAVRGLVADLAELLAAPASD